MERMLVLAKKYSFFDPVISRCGRFVENLRLGHSGSLFSERIKSEWLYSNVTSRDGDIRLFLDNKSDEEDRISKHMKSLGPNKIHKIPFGIAEVFSERTELFPNENPHFNFPSHTVLSSSIVLKAQDATKYYLHWQWRRKLWWKKVGSSPGRFHLGEIKKNGDDESIVDVVAKYDWGLQQLETINMSQYSKISSSSIETPLVIVTNRIILEVAIVGLYLDAFYYDNTNKASVLKLNTNICPYRCNFVIRNIDPTIIDELTELAHYLSKQLKKLNVSTAPLQDFSIITLKAQLSNNDEWGIPYTVILDATTLKTGIVRLRNRDTTLEEEVHISDLNDYVSRLFTKIR